MQVQADSMAYATPRVLSREQLATYWCDGYIVVPRLVPQHELDKYRFVLVQDRDLQVDRPVKGYDLQQVGPPEGPFDLQDGQSICPCRERFVDYCEGRRTKMPGMTIMKDLQLAKSNIKGEKATYKIQDFTMDDVLFGFCQLPQVRRPAQPAYCRSSSTFRAVGDGDCRGYHRRAMPYGDAHDAYQQAARQGFVICSSN